MSTRFSKFLSRQCARNAPLVLTVLIASLIIVASALSQKRGGRDEPDQPAPRPPPPVNTGRGRPKQPSPPPVRRAELTITAPPGSRLWINQNELELRSSNVPINLAGQKVTTTYAGENGTITIKGLKPGSYQIVARKPDYQEFSRVVMAAVETENAVIVSLTLIPGTLTVRPSVSGAEVEVFSVATNSSMGRYTDSLEKIEIAPGRYRLSISKEGHRGSVREVNVNPGESVYLEPIVEALPKPAPTPIRRLSPLPLPSTLSVVSEGKHLIFNINGSTGDDSARRGTINVRSIAGESNVVGALNGTPCLVEFVKLENIAEGALVEAPGPSNNWATVVVRVRPKDRKVPLSFAINWRSLAPVPGSPTEHQSQPFQSLQPAEAVEKVKPIFPRSARLTPAAVGTVRVLIFIDESGSVISAKAIDGPPVFRQVSEEAARKWKFRPALRSGRPVPSEQTIQFTFEN
jgi:hypothetical protein